MTIQAKLASVLSVTVALSVAACCLAFVEIQRDALRRSETEKENLLLESVGKVAQESLVASDPLMLISYLTFLRRERHEIVGCRVLIDGDWQDILAPRPSDPVSPSDGRGPRLVEAELPGAKRAVELSLSSSLLARRERLEFEAMLRRVAAVGVSAVLLGALLSVPLSRTMTRRLVAVERALGEIGAENYAQAVEVTGNDEIARLSRGVNEMARKLGELEEMKKLLVASVSHELRSPLGAIESQVRQMLSENGHLGEAARAHLDSIRKHASRLEHFVSSMLEVAKIERGRLEYFPRVSHIGPVVEDAALFFSQRARDASLRLEADVEPGLPASKFDPDLIGQALANLLSNAIKFTPAGGLIRLRAGRAGDRIILSVEDTGVGIPAEAMGRIFAPFERVANPLHATGTGLGLAITKAIVERHRGRIRVQSTPGKGSAFSIELPISETKPAAS